MDQYRVVVGGKEVGRTPIKEQAKEAAIGYARITHEIVTYERKLKDGSWYEIGRTFH